MFSKFFKQVKTKKRQRAMIEARERAEAHGDGKELLADVEDFEEGPPAAKKKAAADGTTATEKALATAVAAAAAAAKLPETNESKLRRETAEIWKTIVEEEIKSDKQKIRPSDELRKVFVGNIRRPKEAIEKLFAEMTEGEVEKVFIVPPKKKGAKPSAAIVEFATVEQVKKAIELGDGTTVAGEKIRVQKMVSPELQKKAAEVGDSRVVYVRNLSFDTTEADLHKAFDPCGKIVHMKLPKHRDTGNPKGAAFIEFEDGRALKSALEMDRASIRGRTILVSVSTRQTTC